MKVNDYNEAFCGSTVSALIERLQKIRAEHGDRLVWVAGDDAVTRMFECGVRDDADGFGEYVVIA